MIRIRGWIDAALEQRGLMIVLALVLLPALAFMVVHELVDEWLDATLPLCGVIVFLVSVAGARRARCALDPRPLPVGLRGPPLGTVEGYGPSPPGPQVCLPLLH